MVELNKASAAPLPALHRDWLKIRRAGEFARLGFELAAELPAEWFERCKPAADAADAMLGIEGAVQARVAGLAPRCGDRPLAGPSGLIVEANACIRLNCQSCGKDYREQVASTSTLWVARDAAELARWEQAAESDPQAGGVSSCVEALLEEESVSALQLVEDELLLCLPYVPRCPECQPNDSPRRIELF